MQPEQQANPARPESEDVPYTTVMIDQGFCFNAGEWNFPDAPLRGLYARNRVYEGITGTESFAPWLSRLEDRITEKAIAAILQELPPEWYDDDMDTLLAVASAFRNSYSRQKRQRVIPFPIGCKTWTAQ